MTEKKSTILIVDDDKFLLDMYSLKFKEKGFTVLSALGSMEALEMIQGEEKPDVLLMDIVMPVMDGFELLKKVRDSNLLPEAKVIILSNLGQLSDINKGKELGVDGYIVKASATPTEVVGRVEQIMQGQPDPGLSESQQ